LLFAPLTSIAQDTGTSPKAVPPIIATGMRAYKGGGPDAAIQAWIKGGPLDGNRSALSQANTLHQVQDFYGAYQSFDVLAVRSLDPRTHIFYLILNLERGPLFAKFVVYRSGDDWIVTSFNFNTSDEAILPPSLE
jgi:hypothetical protein